MYRMIGCGRIRVHHVTIGPFEWISIYGIFMMILIIMAWKMEMWSNPKDRMMYHVVVVAAAAAAAAVDHDDDDTIYKDFLSF